MISVPISGIILALLGIVYIIKPNIFRRWIWKKTDIAQQVLTPAQYNRYMRILGIVLIILGSYLFFKGKR